MIVSFVAFHVSAQLRFPPAGMRLWKAAVDRAHVPKTPVDEYSHPLGGEEKVGPGSCHSTYGGMDTKTIAEMEQLTTNGYFKGSIALARVPHPSCDGC